MVLFPQPGFSVSSSKSSSGNRTAAVSTARLDLRRDVFAFRHRGRAVLLHCAAVSDVDRRRHGNVRNLGTRPAVAEYATCLRAAMERAFGRRYLLLPPALAGCA